MFTYNDVDLSEAEMSMVFNKNTSTASALVYSRAHWMDINFIQLSEDELSMFNDVAYED